MQPLGVAISSIAARVRGERCDRCRDRRPVRIIHERDCAIDVGGSDPHPAVCDHCGHERLTVQIVHTEMPLPAGRR